MPGPESTRHDVVVVGGRCAGAATARLLAAAGHDVVILERSDLTADPLSTHAIARGGVVQLDRWGLLGAVLDSGAPPVRSVTFGSTAGERIVAIKDRAGVDFLLAPRRTHLDRILAESARAAGARLHLGERVEGVVRDGSGRASGVRTRTADGRPVTRLAKYVVGADGLRSRMATLLGAQVRQSFCADVATFYTYVDAVPWHGFELHVGPGAYAGVFPSHDGQAAVWLCRPTSRSGAVRDAGAQRAEVLLDTVATVAPGLGRRLRTGRVVAPVRGIVAPPNHVRQATGPGWALVGDAGYHRDPITGHGITDAFRDAELLADALHRALERPGEEGEALTTYERRRDAAIGEVFRITRDLCRFPAPSRFGELQVELADALDREAQLLASLPAAAGSPAGAPA
jgi:flavin-dependent dehydrogenase